MQIRPFSPADIDALYAVSLATGHLGGDAAHLYDDPKMMGHIYSAPYALLEPSLMLLAEDSEGVAGFAAGTLDTAGWEERLEQEWWPHLRQRYADPAGIEPALRTVDQRRAFMIHHPERTPATVAQRYRAHLHLNLLPRLQGRGMGGKLFRAWLEAAARDGQATAMHVGVNRANPRALGFWEAQGFEALTTEEAPETRTVWMVRG